MELSLRSVCTEGASEERAEDTGRAQGAPEVSHSRWRMKEGWGDGESRERCYHFHLLLRVGVRGIAENR